MVFREHRGKSLGILFGLLFGLLTVLLGFWKTFFVALCISVGYFIGKRIDENGNFRDWVNKILGKD